jgi:hypothetical protein
MGGGATVRDALDPDHWVNGGECDHPHPDALAMDALYAENKQLRAEVERLREAQRWIPVEERLPEANTAVLTRWRGETFSVDWRFPSGEWTTGSFVTHWMPLPPPPKEVQG